MSPIVAARPAPRTIAPMPQPDREPARRHAAAAGRRDEPAPRAVQDRDGAAPPAALIGRLRGAIPAGDDHRAGLRRAARTRPAQRADRVRGHRPLQRRPDRRQRSSSPMIEDVRLLDGADGTADLLVVTDDRDLRHGARLRGARTAGSAWLLGRLDARGWRRRRSATRDRAHRRRRDRPPSTSPASRATATRPRWTARAGKPGRGATTKKRQPATRLPRRVGLVGCGREYHRRA